MTERTKLILEHLPLVNMIAGRVHSTLPKHVELCDLVQAGRLGLIDAVDKYNPEKKVKPKTYFEFRVRGSIYDYLREVGAATGYNRFLGRLKRIKEGADHEALHNFGRMPTDEEYMKAFGVDGEKLHELLSKIEIYADRNLFDIQINGGLDDQSIDIFDVVPDPRPIPSDVLYEKEITNYLSDIIFVLPEQERMVMEMYYYEQLTMGEIGRILEVTESRVSQVHTKALNRLRRMIDKTKLLG